MNLAMNEVRPRLEDFIGRRRGKDAIARAADVAERASAHGDWKKYAGAALVGFTVGAALLGGRKAAMQATTGLAGDWFAALKADHRLVDELFKVLARTEDHETGKRQTIFSKIAYALAKHQFEEEHVIYPALRDQGDPGAARHLDGEHFEMKTYIHELMEMPKNTRQWLNKAGALHRLIQDHVRQEEEVVFPPLRAKLTKKQNAHLSRAMHREGLKLA